MFAMAVNKGAENEHETEACVRPLEITNPILLVDDSQDTLALLRLVFAHHGCRVLVADSAREALKLVTTEKPGIVISDIGMPDVDGYELLKQLRRIPGMDKVPAIALSGYAMEEDRARALAAGFSAHIAKPVDPEALLTLVQQLTSS